MHEKEIGEYHDDDDEESILSIGNEALEALQSVLGVGLDRLSFQTLIESRRYEQEEDEDEVNNSFHVMDQDGRIGTATKNAEVSSKESHAEYYKRLFPERYLNASEQCPTRSTGKIVNPVALVTVEDDYVKNIIIDAFCKYRPNWQVLTQLPIANETIYHFHWGEYEHIEWFSNRFHAEEILVSCYYNRKGLIRKANLAHILEKWQAKYKDKRLPIAPKSYILRLPLLSYHDEFTDVSNHEEIIRQPKDESFMSEDFLLAFEQSIHESGFPGFESKEKNCTSSTHGNSGLTLESEVWILKPSITNQANGIKLVTSMNQLRGAIYNSDPIQLAGDFVLQTYLPPLLIDGRKFHLRVFMILHGNITAYVCPHFLAIFSLRKYVDAPLSDTRAHLTNIAHQDVQSIEDQHRCMRLFDETIHDMVDSSLVGNIEEAMTRISDVRQRIYDIIAETVAAVTSELTFSPKNNCFEVFGLDFMIDNEWNVYLLEANAEPDLSKAGDRLQHVIDNIILNTLSVVLESDIRFSNHSSNDPENHHLVKVFDRRRSF